MFHMNVDIQVVFSFNLKVTDFYISVFVHIEKDLSS